MLCGGQSYYVVCAVLVFWWPICVWSSKEYMCCVCDPSVCQGVPSIRHICVFVWGIWFQSLTLAFCAPTLFCVLPRVSCAPGAVCMLSASFLSGCGAYLRGELCLRRRRLQVCISGCGWTSEKSNIRVCSEPYPTCVPQVREYVSALFQFAFGASVECRDHGKVIRVQRVRARLCGCTMLRKMLWCPARWPGEVTRRGGPP